MMATMCFEKAHDTYGEKLAKASGLRADADRLHDLIPEMASTARRQAAEIFYSIGKAAPAADCFYMLKDYERAGTIIFPLYTLFILILCKQEVLKLQLWHSMIPIFCFPEDISFLLPC